MKIEDIKNIKVIYNGSDDDVLEDVKVTYEETFYGANKIYETLSTKYPNVQLVLIRKESIAEQLAEFEEGSLVFNYCEWTGNNIKDELELLKEVEARNFPYTGCSYDEHGLLLDKTIMKNEIKKRGFDNLNYIFADENTDVSELNGLSFPVIIKPTLEHCSIGLDDDSVAFDAQTALDKAKSVSKKYQQKVMVEEFANGNEYQAFVFETEKGLETLPVYETRYKASDKPVLVTFEDNWTDSHIDEKVERIGILQDQEKDQAIRLLATKLFASFGGKGYVRVDFRERDGKLYVLELNPNPSIAWTDEQDFINVCATGAGMTFEQVLDWVVSGARKV